MAVAEYGAIEYGEAEYGDSEAVVVGAGDYRELSAKLAVTRPKANLARVEISARLTVKRD